jgi:Tol biopolymer transport system component
MRLFLSITFAVALLLAVGLSPAAPAVEAQGTCGTAPPARLIAGQTARVTISTGTGNNLRATPDGNATVLGVMPEGEVFTVIAGPQCVENLWWWQVRRWDGQTGWTAEGVTGDYWVEPWPTQGAKYATGPAPNLDPALLAFASQQQDALERMAYSMRTNGQNLRSLGNIAIDPEMAEVKLAWSPDGSRVAFSDGRDLWVVSETTVLNVTNATTGTNTWPVWSPDGMRIAFVSDRDGNAEIYSMNADGSNPLNLTNNAALDDTPAWSPDGTRIAFVSDRGGSKGIYQMSAADGTGLLPLSADPLTDNVMPAWSPDGLRLAYVAQSETYADLMVLEGNASRKLTVNVLASHPVWSPDSKRVAYKVETGPATDQFNLFTVRFDGTDPMQLTIDNSRIAGVSWSPDGQWLAFSNDVTSNYELYLIRANGVGLVNLTNSPVTQDMFPVFQPPTTPGVLQPGTPATPAGPAPVENPAEQDLLLIYDAGVPVFTLQNVSGAEINLAPLAFRGAGLTVPVTIWAEYTSSPLERFKNLGCLQVWGFNLPEQPAPAECGDARQGWITNDSYLFWTQGTFEVLYNNTVVATCDVAAGRCTVDLP